MEESVQDQALKLGERKSSRGVYALVRLFVRQVMYRFFAVHIEGRAGLSTPGPLIVAPVHRSNLDVLLIAGTSDRRVRSLAKESMFKGPFLTWLFAALGAFPVQRGSADRAALNAARMLLERGEAVLVFPEGTRQTGRDVGEIFDGVAYLAAKTGARVVPVGLAGTEESLPPHAKYPRRSKVELIVGAVIDTPRSESGRVTRSLREDFSLKLQASLQAAQDEANQRRDARMNGRNSPGTSKGLDRLRALRRPRT